MELLQCQRTNVAATHDSMKAKVTFLSCYYFFKPVQLIAKRWASKKKVIVFNALELLFVLRNISRSYFYGTTTMESRSKTIEYPLIGEPLDDSFSPPRLPANKDVLGRFFYHFKVQQLSQQNRVNQTCSEIINIWRRFRMEQHQAIVAFKLRKQVKRKLTHKS